jgi:pimeloyl-ACP methyl ester carboxylesterase
MHVKLARRWARLGFDVFRVDLSGIGDSPVAANAQENVTYPPSGLEDVGEAICSLGSKRVIVVGHCSGGDYAFQIGAREPSVAGVCIVNPRTFCVLDLAAVEAGDGAPPTTAVDDVPRTLRRMAERGVETLLLVSRNDPGVTYVDTHAADAMRALTGAAGFQRVDVAGADHAFTPLDAQERVSNVLTDHLVARY